ncbi:MAG TPA: V-type ATPase 116kDa subunit family protein [Gemmatimonadaceae bacterium]|nr:V-type ATPase 116kDa subunit family protein [Gemmatimonadaceae bacterium]
MIVPMSRVRIIGPKDVVDAVLRAVQDLGQLQLAELPDRAGVRPARLGPARERRRRQLTRLLEDARDALHSLRVAPHRVAPATITTADFARWARLARRTRREARTLLDRQAALHDERALIARYREFLLAVLPAIRKVANSKRLTSHAVVVPASARGTVDGLASALREELGAEFTMSIHPLPGGDVAILLILPDEFSNRLEARLAEARVPEVPLPDAYRSLPLAETVPQMLARLMAIPAEVGECERSLTALRKAHGGEMTKAQAVVQDWLAAASARERTAETGHAFTIEGWLPARSVAPLEQRVREAAGPTVIVETIAREDWGAEDAPVVLSNPRLFRPFEKLIALLPLPRYGSIDPTPFVAVFFPLIFGMMLGDVGYGIVLGAIALIVHARAKPGSLARTAAEIAGPCAAFAIVFGVLFGEFFGDIARRTLGVRPLLLDREQAVFATLAAAVGLGVVHVVLGLALGAVAAGRKDARRAVGRGVSAVMVLLVVAALLAAFKVLPARLFTPAVILLLVAFPVLVFAEGVLGMIELMTTLGNVLSYARVMAIGTASVILAVVANQMVGAVGSTVVGLLFALLFHLVNFAIGVFSPAIHALRLHYVEFFGKFYSPGGRPYEPFGHGTAAAVPATQEKPA